MGNDQLQHYLPEIYLKGFTDFSGQVWRYDRLDGASKLLPPRVIGAEKNLYSIVDDKGISQNIETLWFNPMDGTFSAILRKLEIDEPLSTREITELAMFIAYLRIRTPASIRETELRFQQLETLVGSSDTTVKYYPNNPNVLAEHEESFTLKTEQAHPVSTRRGEAAARNNVLQVLVRSGQELARALLDLGWALLCAPTGHNFIVADSPFVTVPPVSHDIDLEGIGPLTDGAATFVPLSSGLCMRMTRSQPRELIRRQLESSAVDSINACQVMNSEKYLFGSSEGLVGKLTTAISSPGLNLAVVVTREAGSTSRVGSGLLHTFTKSKIPSGWGARVPLA